MSKKSLDEILKLLPELSKVELSTVRNHCSGLISIGKEKPSISEIRQDWLLEGILQELRSRGLGETIPSEFFIRNKSSFGNYAERSEKIRKLVGNAIGNSSVDLLALGRVLGRLLAQRVNSFAPISLETLLRNVGMIPEAIDAAYPGYLAAGMLPMLVRALHGKGVGALSEED